MHEKYERRGEANPENLNTEAVGLSIRDEPPPRLAILPTPEGTIVALTYAQHLVED